VAIVAYTDGVVKATIGKTRRACAYRKLTWAQHARFLASANPTYIDILFARRCLDFNNFVLGLGLVNYGLGLDTCGLGLGVSGLDSITDKLCINRVTIK